MPAPIATKAQVLVRIMDAFRRDGYDGASLATISERTGLGKSSLYHHFPGGKSQMAAEVLAHLHEMLRATFRAVGEEPDPRRRLDRMLDVIDAFYAGGEKACLLERLGASVDRAQFVTPLRATYAEWMAATESIGRAAGLGADTARRRAEDAVVRIEGALVVAAGTGDTGVFRRTLDDLRATLLAPE